MRKVFLTIVFLAVSFSCFSQITTTKVAPKTEKIDNAPYDSTQNFLGRDVHKYIGQELYLKGMSDGMRKYGYRNFVIDHTQKTLANKSNVYKCCDGSNSKYNELAGKYFKVLDAIKPPIPEEEYLKILYGDNRFFLKLQETESSDIIYYQYDSESDKYTFPFLVVGFFAKQKQIMIGKEFIIRGINWISALEPITDMRTGNPIINFEAGSKWKCVDLTVEERFYDLALILENDKGEQVPIGIDYSKNQNFIFEYNQAERFKKKFGNENWKLILRGDVKIGMTKEMCELSWGTPSKINQTIIAGKKTEQWVYSDNYLYFDNGILTAMQ